MDEKTKSPFSTFSGFYFRVSWNVDEEVYRVETMKKENALLLANVLKSKFVVKCFQIDCKTNEIIGQINIDDKSKR